MLICRYIILTILASIVFIASLVGCNDKVNSPPSKEAAVTKKLQPFVVCLNRTDKSLMDKAPMYRSFYAMVAAAPGKDHYMTPFTGFQITPSETNNEVSRQCIAGLNKAAAQKPSDPLLDRLGRDYAATLETMIPVMNDIDNYYAQKNYRDDKMAKGRALNAKIEPLLTHLADLSKQLRKEVRLRQDRIADTQLAKIEQSEGKGFAWQTENVMLQAQRTFFRISSSFENNRLDTKAVTDAETQMQKAFDSALAYGAANPDVKTKLGNQPMWFCLKANAQGYLQAIKTLRRNAAESKRHLSEDGKNLEEAYNRLVEDYNLRVGYQ
jgi:hypothetical protein